MKNIISIAALVSANAFATGSTPPAPASTSSASQQQDQQQNQQQGQTANGGNATGVGYGGNASSSAAVYDAGGRGGSASAQGGTASANNSLSLHMDAQLRDPVSTATAPALAVANGTCMGSTSAGAQGVSFGVSFGGTWVDQGCDARYDAILLTTMGLDKVAQARVCQKPEIAKAMADAGQYCPGAPAPVADAQPSSYGGYTGNDPIVRARMAGN